MAMSTITRSPNMKSHCLLLVSIMLGGILVVSAVSSMIDGVTIGSSGIIVVPTIDYKSETRAVFVHSKSTIGANWTTMANTLAPYGINVVAIEWLGNNFARYPSNIVPYVDCHLDQAVAAFHAKGIEVYADMNVLLSAYTGDGIDRRVLAISGSGNISSIAPYSWLSPANSASQTLLRGLVQEVVGNYSVDGFMFDYIRFDTGADMPYDTASKNNFIAVTGLTDVDWPADVVSTAKGGTGKYFDQFMEWRTTIIDALVENMTTWIHAINPNVKIASTAWNFGSLNPAYWRYWIGQDTTYWISQGWLDWVAPMMYGNSTSGFASSMQGWKTYATGGPHGIIPIVPFITDQVDYIRTPTDVARYVSTLRANGADGWIIWEYGGPGDVAGSDSPDIRNYLSALNLPLPYTFAMSVPSVRKINSTSVQITWSTSLPATSNVEYNTSQLFTTSYQFWSSTNFHYWQISNIVGTMVGNSANVTNHSITLTNLTSGAMYYFRVQSQDPSGIATSKVFTFNT